jgi:hypothetical protein
MLLTTASYFDQLADEAIRLGIVARVWRYKRTADEFRCLAGLVQIDETVRRLRVVA